MFKRTITICLTVAALGAGVTACGGSSSDEPAAAAKAPAAGGTAVSVQDNSFKPADLKVAVGDTVTFTNEGAIAHTVTATEGADFDSGSLASGSEVQLHRREGRDRELRVHLPPRHAGHDRGRLTRPRGGPRGPDPGPRGHGRRSGRAVGSVGDEETRND